MSTSQAHNEVLGYLVVDKATLADAEKQSQWAAKKLVWVPDKDHGYMPGSLKVSCYCKTYYKLLLGIRW